MVPQQIGLDDGGGEIDWLLDATNQMLLCHDIAALLDVAYEALSEGLGYTYAGLALLDPQHHGLIDDTGVDRAEHGFHSLDHVWPRDGGATWSDMLSDPRLQPSGPGFIYLVDALHDMPVRRRHVRRNTARQILHVSLRTRAEVLGLISVDSVTSGRSITPIDAPPLVVFANALALAVQNIALSKHRARYGDALAHDVHRRIAHLEWLSEISRRIAAARTLDDVLDVVYDGIREALGYDRVGITLFEHERGLWQERRGTDEHGHKTYPLDRVQALGPGSPIWRLPDVAALLRGAELHFTNNAHAATPPDLRYLLDGTPTQQLAVPLRAGETVVGMICVDNLLTHRPIRREEAGPLLALAHQVATAVENARLLEHEQAERTRAEEALRTSEERFRALTEHTADLVTVLDARGIIDYVSLSYHQGLGYTPDSLQGTSAFDTIHPDDVDRARSLFNQLLADANATGRTVLRVHHADGTWRVLELVSKNRLDDPAVRGIIVTGHDVTARTQAEEALRHQALHDSLTGLPNRILLVDRIAQGIRQAERERGPLALLLLDLDRFKEINDTFGHYYGDLLLRQVAERLRRLLRAADTVARLGGDEFALVLPGDNRDGSIVTAGKVRAILDAPFAVEGQAVHVGGSIGITLYPEHGLDAQTLLRHADVAMYVAKRNGEPYALYSSEQDRYTLDRLALIAALRRAIAEGELVLHYQPKVALSSGQPYAVEALVRWIHPQRGLIQPDQFIPLAEEAGLIAPLTWWLLQEALGQCQRWKHAGIDLRVAVNLSMATLLDPQLPSIITQWLRIYEVPGNHLQIEVTESTLMADVGRTQEVLRRLVALGVSICVDDYGTGYSSLAYLKILPVNELKIDKAFIQHMRDDEADTAIVASTIGLGHSLGLQVVAEGVEDLETREQLAAMSCDAAQGYYWSRPLPPAEMERWLRETGRA